MKYIKKLEKTYPIDFFGLRDSSLPEDGMLYFVERRLFNLSFLPIVDVECYRAHNRKWVHIEEFNRLMREEIIEAEKYLKDTTH